MEIVILTLTIDYQWTEYATYRWMV